MTQKRLPRVHHWSDKSGLLHERFLIEANPEDQCDRGHRGGWSYPGRRDSFLWRVRDGRVPGRGGKRAQHLRIEPPDRRRIAGSSSRGEGFSAQERREEDRQQIEFSKSAVANIGILRGKLVATGKPELAAKVDAIDASLKQYQTHFLTVVQEKRQLGLDEKSGLEGKLRSSVHEMETQVNQLHQTELLVTMLMMRRHEKDFILRRDRKYGDEMKNRASEFTAGIVKADIPDAAKSELKRKLGDYQRDFFAWMETALKLSGELKTMSESFSVIEPALEAISSEVNGLKLAADRSSLELRATVQKEMQFAILLIAGAVLTAGFLIGRSVSKPLSAITAAMIDLAKGKFSIVLPGLGRKDEIGDIAQAVESFKLLAEQKA